MRRPNMKSAFVRIAVSLALTLLLAHAALSWQVSYGLQPFGSFSGGPFDIVNNQDLNVHFAIPVLNKAGRGLPFNYSDGYDSTIWSIQHSAWTPANQWGWTVGRGACTRSTRHHPPALHSPSANTLSPSLYWGRHPTTLTDTNGNQISGTVPSIRIITDTLGTPAITAQGQGTPSSPVTFQYTNAAGTTSTVTVNYTAYTVQTNFGCSGITDYPPTSANLVSSITLPDNTSYSFTYEVT